MKMKKAFLIAVLALAAMGASAQSLAGDLKNLIDATGLKYQVTKAGNVAVTYNLDDERSQVVYITGKSSKVGNLIVREVWSNAGYYPGDVDADTLVALLTAGADEALGAWNLEEDEGDYLAYYSTSIPMTLAAADLAEVLEYVAAVADALEVTLSDADDN